jgi:cell division protein FtsZ
VTLFEVDQAAHRIGEEVDKDANIMFGMSLDESLAGRIRVSVVATGIDSSAPQMGQMPKLQVVNGGPADAVAFPPHVTGQQQPGQTPVSRQAGYVPEPPTGSLLSKAFVGREELPLDEPVAVAPAPLQPAPRMAPPVRAAAPQEAPRAPEVPKATSIFKSVFGFGAPKAPAAPQPHRQEPAMHAEAQPELREPARAAVRPAQIDEIGLEIPAFLRRNNP